MIKLPFNKHGGKADPNNEANMLAITVKGLEIMRLQHNILNTEQDRKAILARVMDLQTAQARAIDAASRGDFAWCTAIEQGGKTIQDYWVNGKVVYPSMLNPNNPASRLSFLYYLGHSIENVFMEGHEDFHIHFYQAEQAVKVDDFWVINTLDDVVEV